MNSISFHCLVSLLALCSATGSVRSVGAYASTNNTKSVSWANAPARNATNAVNPILGDISFVEKYGRFPTATTNEKLRISTHLMYVERLLRSKDVSSLHKHLQQRRLRLLAMLHTYTRVGIFPRNYDYASERKPCFIDKHGAICAVGYLIEQTAGRSLVERINA